MEAAQIDKALAKLAASNPYERKKAVEALGNHEAVLAQHAAAVAAKLEDSSDYVRRAAVEALGKHEAVLAQHAAAVAAKLEDSDGTVVKLAVEALGKLNLFDHPAAAAVIVAVCARLSAERVKAVDGLQGLFELVRDERERER